MTDRPDPADVPAKQLGECAVYDCTEPFSKPIKVHGTPVAMVCAHHDQIGNLHGYVLRTGIGTLATIYPPGVRIPDW